jgi:neutral ceramidase
MPYQAGTAIRDITPSRCLLASTKIWLWGYGNRTAPCEGVHTRLSARALAIKDDEGNRIVLVTLDVGMLGPEMTARIRARATAQFGIAPENICINVSHTHGAPVTVSTPTWQLGVAIAHPEYADVLETEISRAIADALHRFQPARLSWARGKTHIGRDRHFKGDMRFYDAALDVLLVRNASPTVGARSDGRSAIATVFVATCHPVCNGDLNKVYADFPGVARDAVEIELGGTAFFLQGYAGTCVPDPDGEEKASETLIGQRLAADVIAVARGPKHELDGPLSARLHTIDLPLQALDPASLPSHKAWGDTLRADNLDLADLIARWTDHMASLTPSLPTSLPTQQQAMRIGEAPNEWYLVASSHEVSMDFGPRVRSLWPCPRVSVIAYSNSQLSYLPSSRVMLHPYAATDFPRDISNYNYTAARSFLWYGQPGPLTVDADDIFIQGFISLLDSGQRAAVDPLHGTRLHVAGEI